LGFLSLVALDRHKSLTCRTSAGPRRPEKSPPSRACSSAWHRVGSKALREERLDLLLLKEVEQGDQILSKQCRSPPFEPLDAVGDHPFPAREKPAASNVQPEDGDSMKAMTAT